jgi:hypothetical protein
MVVVFGLVYMSGRESGKLERKHAVTSGGVGDDVGAEKSEGKPSSY